MRPSGFPDSAVLTQTLKPRRLFASLRHDLSRALIQSKNSVPFYRRRLSFFLSIDQGWDTTTFDLRTLLQPNVDNSCEQKGIPRSCDTPTPLPCAILFPFTGWLGYTCCRMRSLALVLLAVLPAAALGQTATKTPAPDKLQNEALVFERTETAVRMHADGTGERVIHVCIRLQSEGAARQFGVLSFSYAAANETPHITLVRVHKPDGSTVDTPAADAMDMPAAVTREAPLYSDLKEKHLPVRSLATGDTLEYEVHVSIDKAEAPSQFWGVTAFHPAGLRHRARGRFHPRGAQRQVCAGLESKP